MKKESEVSVEKIVSEKNPKDKRNRRILFLSGIIILLLGATWFFTQSSQGGIDTVNFKTVQVTRADLVISVTATGNLEATNQVDVGSELSGRITKMIVDYNDSVTENQPLVYLDDSKYVAAVAQSKSGVATAKANYMEALATRSANKKTLLRYKKTRELTKGKMPSLEDLEGAQADYERSVASVAAAKASIETAEAALTSDEADLKKTIIYSPINGIVLDKTVEVGQTVAASYEAPTLYTIAEDLRSMELVVDVDEADVGQVKEGQDATFSVDAYPERTFQAKITQVRYGADDNDGVITYETVLQVGNPDLSLRPGMTATADITVEEYKDTLLVPNSALRFSLPKPSEEMSGGDNKKGLLGSLMPGPGRFNKSSSKHAEERGAGEQGQATVWIIAAGKPEPVQVTKKATDGAMAAVESDKLTTDTQVITTSVTSTK